MQVHARQIEEALYTHGMRYVCPICHSQEYRVLGGFVAVTLIDGSEDATGSGKALYCVGIGCADCGFISQHALDSLGLANLMQAGDYQD